MAVGDRYFLSRPAELASLAAFRDLVDTACREHPGIGPETSYDLKLAVDEACTIILTHGSAELNAGPITLALDYEPDEVVVNLTDLGQPFEPYEPVMPDLDEDCDESTDCLGMFFIYQTMDEVRYRAAEDGNHLTLVKLLAG